MADPEQLVERVQLLTAELETISDPGARMVAEGLTAAILDLYGAGLERILAHVEAGLPETERLRGALVDDGIVASLLLIHGLYPVSLEERVAEALDGVRPYMETHGGDVELLGIEDGVARLRLQGSCSGCAASAATLELAIKQALEEAAPDLVGLEVEGVAEPPPPAGPLLPLAGGGGSLGTVLPMVPNGSGPVPVAPAWFTAPGVDGLEAGALAPIRVAGAELVVANVGGTLLAYRDACASCGSELAAGELCAGVLACPACGARFDLPAAGRSLDDAGQLEPVPLLHEPEGVRVALAV